MKSLVRLAFVFVATLLLTSISSKALTLSGRIDLTKVFFGIEYTFQDQEMVNEPGRNTTRTPHKEQKARDLAFSIAHILKLEDDAVTIKTTWKPGNFVTVPNDGKWVVNAEPVTIEVNTTPRHFADIEATAEPIYQAAKQNDLVPYINVAAERSGMGHVHVGAASIGENPFFEHPLLLRNVMVYLHKHPSLLYGFSEAYDNGIGSNIETYHADSRQKEFQAAVEAFDAWYAQATPEQRKADGFNTFLRKLKEHDRTSGFFKHYRFMNLEHVARGGYLPHETGKLTVEFRNFRPPNSPGMAKAFASLLVAIMEKQSEPEHHEAFEMITPDACDRFNTGSKVSSDWQIVREELGLTNANLDLAVGEYVMNLHHQPVEVPSLKGAELFPAYSEKEQKGTYFELRLPLTRYPQAPELSVNDHRLAFEQVQVNGGVYWVSSIHTKALGVSPIELLNGRVRFTHGSQKQRCEELFGLTRTL